MVAVLDLDILYYPCPRGSPNFRPKVKQMGGKQQFPYMVWHFILIIFSFFFIFPTRTILGSNCLCPDMSLLRVQIHYALVTGMWFKKTSVIAKSLEIFAIYSYLFMNCQKP